MRILIVDTNRAAVPIYNHCLSLGHEVFVVGSNPNEPLAKLSANFILSDYSNLEALKAVLESHSINYLVPGCTDLSYGQCAKVADGAFRGRFFELDSEDTFSRLNDKKRFRELALQLGLTVPKVISVEDVSAFESVIVKPVDSFSGRGVSVLKTPSPEKVNDAVALARGQSATGEALIEEFVSGQLFSHTAFLSHGDIHVDFVVREDCVVNPFAVDCSFVEHDFPAPILSRLRQEAQKLCAHLEISSGLLHTQFILKGDKFWIIEVTRRCPGDLYSLLIEYSTGFPYAACYANAFLGETLPPASLASKKERVIRHTVTTPSAEHLLGFRFSRPVDLLNLVPLAAMGDEIKQSPNGRAAILFLRAASDEEREEIYHDLMCNTLLTFNRV